MNDGRRERAVDPAPADTVWDAGDLACGELIVRLQLRMREMRPGQVLRLVALDSGAPADLPAWCRLTGHVLLAADPPVYVIRRKEH